MTTEHDLPENALSDETSAAHDFAIADQLASKLDDSDPLAPPGEQAAEPVTVSLADILKPAIQTTFDLAVPHWKIKDHESQALADSYGAVFELFWPNLDVDPRYAALGMAALTTFAVIGPRLKADKEAEEKAEQKQQKQLTQKEAPTALQYDKAADPLNWNTPGG